jgi:hypothetical protein
MGEHHTQPLDAAAPEGNRVAAPSDLLSYRTILMAVDRGVATITLNRHWPAWTAQSNPSDQRRRSLTGAAGLPALRFGVGIERRTLV